MHTGWQQCGQKRNKRCRGANMARCWMTDWTKTTSGQGKEHHLVENKLKLKGMVLVFVTFLQTMKELLYPLTHFAHLWELLTYSAQKIRSVSLGVRNLCNSSHKNHTDKNESVSLGNSEFKDGFDLSSQAESDSGMTKTLALNNIRVSL